MSQGRALGTGEQEILTAVGYLVMKWNYAEHCARQILRGYLSGTSLDAPDHLKLSSKMAKWIEDELRDAALPRWTGVGRPYLEALIDAYSIAREHRNQIVHGLWATANTQGPHGATAILMNEMPRDSKVVAPKHMRRSDLQPLIEHFTLLAEYSQNVMVAFDTSGARTLKRDGSPALDPLPPLIAALPPCEFETIDI